MASGPQVRDVLIVRLPTHAPPGHEQQGYRPVLVVAEPKKAGKMRFEMIYAAPLTSQLEDWARVNSDLYPVLNKGIGGLTQNSAVLTEHARGIDATRVVRRLGKLTPEQYAPVQKLLEKMFGFSSENEAA